jgi:hypothetical protein
MLSTLRLLSLPRSSAVSPPSGLRLMGAPGASRSGARIRHEGVATERCGDAERMGVAARLEPRRGRLDARAIPCGTRSCVGGRPRLKVRQLGRAEGGESDRSAADAAGVCTSRGVSRTDGRVPSSAVLPTDATVASGSGRLERRVAGSGMWADAVSKGDAKAGRRWRREEAQPSAACSSAVRERRGVHRGPGALAVHVRVAASDRSGPAAKGACRMGRVYPFGAEANWGLGDWNATGAAIGRDGTLAGRVGMWLSSR